jgi:hypothetical protein
MNDNLGKTEKNNEIALKNFEEIKQYSVNLLIEKNECAVKYEWMLEKFNNNRNKYEKYMEFIKDIKYKIVEYNKLNKIDIHTLFINVTKIKNSNGINSNR